MVILYCSIFISLWTLGTLMLVNNPKQGHVRWFSALLYVTGFASFSVVLNISLLPWMRTSSSFAPETAETVRLFSMLIWGLEYHFLPYLLLMCSLVFTRIFRSKSILLFSLLLPLPILIYLATLPPLYPVLQLGHPSFRIMSGIYFAAGLSVYWLRYAAERNPHHKKNSFRTAAALMVCISFLYATDYYGLDHFLIGRDGLKIVSNNMWQFNFLIALVFVSMFVFYSMKYGFMGIKMRIEKQKIDYSMRNLTKGALILNHTIKNEVQKINYLSSRMRGAVVNDDKEETLRNLENLDHVAEHILKMVNQFKERTDGIVLHEQEHRLADLLEISVQTLEPVLQEKRVQIVRDIQIDPILICDGTHIREVIGNLLANAVDALEQDNGQISITVQKIKKNILVWVKDNGTGIPKESAAKMFDPFFTTKKGTSNYGLGLNYCYAVMQKHGGGIRLVDSNPGLGTWMELRFPSRRMRQITAVKSSSPLQAGV